MNSRPLRLKNVCDKQALFEIRQMWRSSLLRYFISLEIILVSCLAFKWEHCWSLDFRWVSDLSLFEFIVFNSFIFILHAIFFRVVRSLSLLIRVLFHLDLYIVYFCLFMFIFLVYIVRIFLRNCEQDFWRLSNIPEEEKQLCSQNITFCRIQYFRWLFKTPLSLFFSFVFWNGKGREA
jgi:hypothetical protein